MAKRRAKIVGTLGPSSSSVEKISKLIEVGLNVARVNMSHGTHEGHKQTIANVRKASKEMGYEVAILLDLQGPKIRVDKLEEPIELKNGETWAIGTMKAHASNTQYQDCFIPTVYEDLVKDAKVGCTILFDDGLMEAKAVKKEKDVLVIEVIQGGTLKSNKGINLPDIAVSAPSFTEKDHKDLLFGLQNGIDYVALSFVRTAEDIKQVKYLLHSLKTNVPIVSKIEKPEAIENIEEIIKVSDAIMIARGDMGVELGNHLVPSVQKNIIHLCNSYGKAVITATQMLESMIVSPRPTRAEASDVANAIWDGTDAVMLSAETASGNFPVEAVVMMGKIIEEAERVPKDRPLLRNIDLSDVSSSLQVAASMIAEKLFARWVLVVTQTGNSAKKISRFRPRSPVLAVTNSVTVVRKMCLYWGVSPYQFSNYQELSELENQMLQELKSKKLIENGDKLVIARGDGKFFRQGTSNTLRVHTINDIPKEANSSKGLQDAEFDRGKILLDTNICVSCQNCISICPFDIWTNSKEFNNSTRINEANAHRCTLDMECVNMCPAGAIEIISKV
ncbi:MAG: pyruvate kinase [Bacteriovoracaceae bacterium]|jgi:pyruvate kinase|nr:pyruvate kinase [Bacteriovoracaceae bacterium]